MDTSLLLPTSATVPGASSSVGRISPAWYLPPPPPSPSHAHTHTSGNTPLMLAADVGNSAALSLLLEHGANINCRVG